MNDGKGGVLIWDYAEFSLTTSNVNFASNLSGRCAALNMGGIVWGM